MTSLLRWPVFTSPRVAGFARPVTLLQLPVEQRRVIGDRSRSVRNTAARRRMVGDAAVGRVSPRATCSLGLTSAEENDTKG
jgi:hypothetical protein